MLREWLEKNLQEPFLRAEMVKTEINATPGAEANLGTIKALGIFGALYMMVCAYWFARYIIA
jgi:hypothetical protein